ncbi:hypothetical protein E2C01_068168 [Portunus trituberculatus]|uniref:Uncharacterized protein n=1 Tax=Portunus trituberculatus TaxID=210409 RepID=A0A5B7HYR0_PORTR|nr:hypothetical protein [Portunus trituberculatus]
MTPTTATLMPLPSTLLTASTTFLTLT